MFAANRMHAKSLADAKGKKTQEFALIIHIVFPGILSIILHMDGSLLNPAEFIVLRL